MIRCVLLLLGLLIPGVAAGDPSQYTPPPSGGSGLVAWTDTQDSAVFSNDGGTDTLTFSVPASAKILFIKTIQITQIGGTYVGGAWNLGITVYLDAAKTTVAKWFPFVNPLPTVAQYDTGTDVLMDVPAYILELNENTWTTNTVQYRVVLTGFYLE